MVDDHKDIGPNDGLNIFLYIHLTYIQQQKHILGNIVLISMNAPPTGISAIPINMKSIKMSLLFDPEMFIFGESTFSVTKLHCYP